MNVSADTQKWTKWVLFIFLKNDVVGWGGVQVMYSVYAQTLCNTDYCGKPTTILCIDCFT